MAYRYLTQHALTGEWLSHDLPLRGVEFGPDLNGPGHLRGSLSPRLAWSHPGLTDPGNTLLYAEAGGRIRWGGIIWQTEPDGGTMQVEAAGWSSYLQYRHDLDGELGGRGPYVNTDPCRVMRDIVAYAQSVPDGDLGISVDKTTSTGKVGSPADPWHSRWWETPVLGDLFDDLVKAPDSPDYTCATWWGKDRRPVRRIRVGYPRLGARRSDIAFSSDTNIVGHTPVTYSADEYAQVVIATGAGEGRSQQRAVDAVRNKRLRLEHVLELPEVRGRDALAQRARRERAWRQNLGHVEEITVRNHPAAPIGSWQVGDDVQVSVRDEWANWSGWCRITGYTVRPDTDSGETAQLQLEPAGAHQYATAA